MSIILGATYTDAAPQFVGIAIAHTDYLGGGCRTQLQTRIERPGQRPVTEWFDDGRLQRLPLIPVAAPAPALSVVESA